MSARISSLKPLGIPEGMDPRQWRLELSKRVAELLEQAGNLIDALDAMTPDVDLEDGGDFEPSLGWPDRGIAALDMRIAQDDEREEENEHGGDVLDERHDALDEGDDEPFMGRPEWGGQGRILGLDPADAEYVFTGSGDDPEDHVSEALSFNGDGKGQAKKMLARLRQ